MKQILIIGAFLAMDAYCATAQINLCDKFTVLHYEPIPVATTPGHYSDGFLVTVNDIQYRIVINKQSKVEFISTFDTSFHLGALSVGTSYHGIPKNMIVSERAREEWGYEVTLKNGWKAVFDDGLENEAHQAYRKSKIKWFYKASDCKVYTTVND